MRALKRQVESLIVRLLRVEAFGASRVSGCELGRDEEEEEGVNCVVLPRVAFEDSVSAMQHLAPDSEAANRRVGGGGGVPIRSSGDRDRCVEGCIGFALILKIPSKRDDDGGGGGGGGGSDTDGVAVSEE